MSIFNDLRLKTHERDHCYIAVVTPSYDQIVRAVPNARNQLKLDPFKKFELYPYLNAAIFINRGEPVIVRRPFAGILQLYNLIDSRFPRVHRPPCHDVQIVVRCLNLECFQIVFEIVICSSVNQRPLFDVEFLEIVKVLYDQMLCLQV